MQQFALLLVAAYADGTPPAAMGSCFVFVGVLFFLLKYLFIL